MSSIPDPTTLHPVPNFDRVVFLRPLITSPKIEVGDYTYYDHAIDPMLFETDNVLYGYGPEKLTIGKFCAIGSDTRFVMAGANHLSSGVSSYPFTIFGGSWADVTHDLLENMASKGDTVVGNDVWFGYSSLVMPGVTVGDGSIVAAGSVVTRDVSPYSIVGGNPATVIRKRFSDEEIEMLCELRWWDWPIEHITANVRTIMSGTPSEIAKLRP